MHGQRQGKFAAMRAQRGFSMLEILVTLFLITMWLLSSAGVQSASLQYNKAAQFRTQAVYLATELAERMQANKTGATAGHYVVSGSVEAAATNCTTATCNAAELAQFDLAEWTGRVAAVLPNASATVSTTGAANPVTYTILITWSDRRSDRTYSGSGTSEAFSYTATKTVYNDAS